MQFSPGLDAGMFCRHTISLSLGQDIMTHPTLKLCAILCVAAGLNACATVTSTPVKGMGFQSDAGGMTYFLPRKLVKLTVSGVKPKVKDAKAKLEKATTAAKAADSAVAALAAQIKVDETFLGTLTAGSEDYKKTESKIKRAKFDKGLAEAAQTAAVTAKNTAQREFTNAENDPAACQYTIKHELTATLPDTTYRFTARPFHNPMRDDTQKFKVTNTGLLTSANVIADDRTDDIIAQSVSLLSGGLKPDPLNKSILFGAPNPGGATAWYCPLTPVTYTYNPHITADAVLTAVSGTSKVNQSLEDLKIPIRIGKVQPLGAGLTTAQLSAMKVLQGGTELTPNMTDALYYRTPVPVILNFELNAGTLDDAKWKPVVSSVAVLPQAGPVNYIPMRSSAFVKSVNDVTFENGVITAWDNESPSEVLELVRFPVKIATSLVSIPAQILSLNVDYSAAQASFATNQALVVAQQARMDFLVNCIADVGDDNDAVMACLNAAALAAPSAAE